MLAPIVLFVYNRPRHTLQTLEALRKNDLADESKLYIYSDGPNESAEEDTLLKIKQTREIIKSKQWCKEVIIIEKDKNAGLADSIVNGVTDIINIHGKIIILEDDIITSSGFLSYMNQALNLYENEKKVMHISGYMYPLKLKKSTSLFLNVVTPWGWGTWKDRWQFYDNDANNLLKKLKNVDFFNQTDFNAGFGNEFYNQLIANADEKLKTWAVKWHSSIFLKRGFCLHPAQSLVNNIGFDNSGTNCESNKFYQISKLKKKVLIIKIPITKDNDALKKFQKFYLKIIKSNNSHFNILKLIKQIGKKIAHKIIISN